MGEFDSVVQGSLERLVDADLASAVLAEPDADIFMLGLNSLQAFELLDDLADAGVDVDFGDFTREPTLTFLRSRAGR